VEAALGTSHRLTETVSGRDLAILNGRRRGTEDFLGRVADPTQLAEPRSKARPIDPVDVFGAASAAAAKADKPSTRIKASCLRSLPETTSKEEIMLQNSGVRALDRRGHRCVRVQSSRSFTFAVTSAEPGSAFDCCVSDSTDQFVIVRV
jgi:hypothetical protein